MVFVDPNELAIATIDDLDVEVTRLLRASKVDEWLLGHWDKEQRENKAFKALNFNKAEDGSPLPHLIYDRTDSTNLFRTGGKKTNVAGSQSLESVIIQFRIVADSDELAKNGKKLAMHAFEQLKAPKRLATNVDICNIKRGPEGRTRLGQSEWEHRITYELMLDLTLSFT